MLRTAVNIAGLSEADFEELAVTAAILSLLERRPIVDVARTLWWLPPLLAESLRSQSETLMVCRANIAITLLMRGNADDRPVAAEFLSLALAAAKRLRLPEAQTMLRIMEQAELQPT